MSIIAVISGGGSLERDISIKSGKYVYETLIHNGHNAKLFDFPKDYQLFVESANDIEFAYIMIHGVGGEDGEISEILEQLMIPYQGCNTDIHKVCMDKIRTKKIWENNNLPIATHISINIGKEGFQSFRSKVSDFGLPCVCKALDQGSSLGMSFCFTEKDISNTYHELQDFKNIMIEKFISGREFTVSILEMTDGETIALPVIEIIAPTGEWFDYNNKYNGKTQEICPADIPDKLRDQIQEISLQAHLTVRCTGYSRVDIMYDTKSQELFLLEINTIPGFTPQSLYPKATDQAGIPFSKLLSILRQTGGQNIEHGA